jgi:hypothetical protein
MLGWSARKSSTASRTTANDGRIMVKLVFDMPNGAHGHVELDPVTDFGAEYGLLMAIPTADVPM